MSTTAELLAKAKRYRAIAQTLSPTVHGPQDKAYYLRLADDLESRAAADGSPATVAATPGSPKFADSFQPKKADNFTLITPKKAESIRLKRQARVHSHLAVAVLSHRKADIHRAFSVWLAIDRSQQKRFAYAAMLQYVADNWHSNARNVRRWLAAGAGIFWDIDGKRGKRTIFFFGKNSLFQRFNLAKPGIVQLVDRNALTGKLTTLRANLFACVVSKEKKWASRKTLQELTAIQPRTQQNYNALNGQKRQSTSIKGVKNSSGGMNRQMPNIYHRLHFTTTKTNKKRYGLYTLESRELAKGRGNRVSSVDATKKLLFETAPAAITALKKYGEGVTFSIDNLTRFNKHVTLIPYAAA